jgi:hypothetical protein
MAIPESQLETWAHQGAIKKSSDTYASIKRVLEANEASYYNKSFEVFLQGSYGNDTNIWADSDVDIVIRLDSIMRSDLSKLSPVEQIAYHAAYSNATYQFSEFKEGVLSQLQNKYDRSNVSLGNKTIKINGSSNRMNSDVLPCYQFRRYKRFRTIDDQQYISGIIFKAASGHEIINYPKHHSGECTKKHQETGDYFKPTIRILKNLRGWMVENNVIVENCAPSYFIEGLFYNVPDEKFGQSYEDTICNSVNWLTKVDWSKFICPNGQYLLFGNKQEHWQEESGREFLNALAKVWEEW